MSTPTLTLARARREFIDAEIARTGEDDPVDDVRSLSLREASREPGIPMTPEVRDEIEADASRLPAENKPP